MLQSYPGVVLVIMLLCRVPYAHPVILHVPDDHSSIQAGITAARPGDTVLVAPGLYLESLIMKPGVRIHGQPGAVLDGSQTFAPVVRALAGVEETAELSGFVIRRGRLAGILLNQATPTIRNNVITEHAGPGIECAQASPRIINNIITHNDGGGVVCKYPGTLPVIEYNDFWQNRPAASVGCTLGANNRYHKPDFVDAEQGDYRLRDTSPLIDAGHPASELNDADGSRSDMGLVRAPQRLQKPQRRFASGPELLQTSLSFQGLPGLIDIPTATMVPPGSLDVNYNVKRDFNIFPTVDNQQNFTFALGLLPRITIGGRGTAAQPDEGRFLARDISANVQFLLLQEGSWWPAVAVGLQDISGGANNFRSRYLTLSKSLFGRVRTTAGFGTGPDTLEGPFAGVELGLNRFITLMGEYDTDDLNAGIRLFPLPQQLQAYGVPRPTVDLIWQDGDDFAWGISLRSELGEVKYRAQRAAVAHKRYRRQTIPSGAELSLQVLTEQLQAELMERGLENVRVSVVRLPQDMMVVVEYENRRYNRDELHGLGLVLGLTTTRTPPEVTQVRIVVKEVNLPVLQFTTSPDDFLAFVNEQISSSTFVRKIHVTNQVQRLAEIGTPVVTTAIGNRSWLKLDAFLRPGIETLLLTEISAAELRFTLLPDAFMQLTPGTVGNLRIRIPVTQTENFPGELDDPEIDRMLLHQAFRLPLGKWSRVATGMMQLSVGLFSDEEVGIAQTTATTFLEGLLLFKSTLARVGSSFTDLDTWVALMEGRIRYPPWDLTLSITGGLFLDGDRGVGADLSRFFGHTEIGVFLRHSDHGSLGGLRFAIPLTPAKELKPMRFRPRLPDVFTHEVRTTVFTDRNVVRSDIGRQLGTGHAIEQVYWNRDRLYPVYVRQHVRTLKQAVRRWVDEN